MLTKLFISETDAIKIVNILSEYKTLQYQQIISLYPKERESSINNLINRLIKEGRLYHDRINHYLATTESDLKTPDESIIKTFWILLDYIDRVEYHSPSVFPVQIVFLMDSEDYEIIHVPQGQEVIINRAQRSDKRNQYVAKRIVLIDDKSQVKDIKVYNTIGYCMENDGNVRYFKRADS